jgi:hypothetical protein
MTMQELKAQISAILDAATVENIQNRDDGEKNLLQFFRENFFSVQEAIIYADSQGVKLRNNPLQQFHILCKNGKLENTRVGEKQIIITKRSLDAWIEQQKQKQANG